MRRTSSAGDAFVAMVWLIIGVTQVTGRTDVSSPITVGSVITLGADSGVAQGEGLFVTHPNKSRILACIMELGPERGFHRVVTRIADSGGSSWKQTFASDWKRAVGDPACAYGIDGTAFLVLAPRTNEPGRLAPSMRLYRSPDGGIAWIEAAEMPMLDRQSIVVDHTNGRFSGRIYVHGVGNSYTFNGVRRGNVTLLHSADGGNTFRGPVVRASSGRGEPFQMGNSVVLPDGTWLTAFGELRQAWQQAESNEGGGRFADSDGIFANADLRVLRSSDGGERLETAGTVSDWHLPVNDRFFVASQPWLAADTTTGPFGGRVYVVWVDNRRGNSDVFFAYSTDGGRRWSDAAIVNDAWRAARQRRDHLMPMVAVNSRGVVGVAWYDRRDASDNRGWTLRFAASVDGGESFLPSVAVPDIHATFGDTATEPIASNVTGGSPDHPVTTRVLFSRFFYIGGDYAGMAVNGQGVFFPYGLGNAGGRHAAMTVPITVIAGASRFGYPELESLTDLTSAVTVETGPTTLNSRTWELSVPMTLRNNGKATMQLPMWVRITRIRSDFGNVVPSNADKSASPDSALWNFDDSIGDVLSPGQRSREKVLHFRISAPLARDPNAMMRIALVSFDARVLGTTSHTERDRH